MMLRPTLTAFLPLFSPSAATLPSLSGVFACEHVFVCVCWIFFFFLKQLWRKNDLPILRGLRGWTRNF